MNLIFTGKARQVFERIKEMKDMAANGGGVIYRGYRINELPQVRRDVIYGNGQYIIEYLDPAPSRALYNHSPDGFEWGSMRDNGTNAKPFIISKFSYKSSGYSCDLAMVWNFMEIKNIAIGNRDMNDKKPHSEFSSQYGFLWDVGFEFDSRVYQYSFSLIGGNKINEKLVTMRGEIENFCKTIVGEVFISGYNFGISTKKFRLCYIKPTSFSCSPDLTLEYKPSFLGGEMLICFPSGIARRGTESLLPGPTGFLTQSIGKFLSDPLTTDNTLNFFIHNILLSFYGNYIMNNPTIINNDGPAQLALALLLDATGDKILALKYHHPFKDAFVAGWGPTWGIRADQIKRWASLKEFHDREAENVQAD